MANIIVDLGRDIVEGETITFRSPAGCAQATGLIVRYPDSGTTVSKTLQFADAHGNNVGGKDLFAAGVLVKVVLDTEKSRAYVQNADTNAYLEGKISAVQTAADSAASAAATAQTTADSKAPAYTYGTEDLTAGSSSLETGKLYFVYE